MTDHTVHSYDDELRELAQKIAEMGGLAEQQVAESVTALSERNASLARDALQLVDPQICRDYVKSIRTTSSKSALRTAARAAHAGASEKPYHAMAPNPATPAVHPDG